MILLLYSDPIVLKGVLSKTQYEHFSHFHAACRILRDEKLATMKNAQAKSYLNKFFNDARTIYKLDVYVMNVHNIVHLAEDAKIMNCSLSKIIAFPFENFLGKLKVCL